MCSTNFVWFEYSDLEHYKPDMNLSAYSIYNTPDMCKRINDELIHAAIRVVKLYRRYEQERVKFNDTEFSINQMLAFIGIIAPYVIKSDTSGKVLCGVDYNFIVNTTKIDNIIRSTRPDKRVYAIRKRVNQMVSTIIKKKKSSYMYALPLIRQILTERVHISELVNFTALYFIIPNVARQENPIKDKPHMLIFNPDSIAQETYAIWVRLLEQNPLK